MVIRCVHEPDTDFFNGACNLFRRQIDIDIQRFQQIGALLFAGENTSRFLLLEMRLQQTMADVFKTLSDAAGLDMPGM